MLREAQPDLSKLATIDTFKAAVGEITKDIQERFDTLEKALDGKFAQAETVKGLQDKVDELGKRAQPGGPFVGIPRAEEKTMAINKTVERGAVSTETLTRMRQLEEMTKSGIPELAHSAQRSLKRLLAEQGDDL